MTKYHFKNAITHAEVQISDKVNFFADFFEFVANDLGILQGFELENHRSLLEKVSTQLTNHTVHSKRYINHYFMNQYLSGKDFLVKEYYPTEWKKLNAAKKKYEGDKDPIPFQARVMEFHTVLTQSLFKNALNEIITAIQCVHPLEKHNHVKIFEYCTPILVTEFVFAGFDKKELSSLFKNIFAREIRLEAGKVRTLAPLPDDLMKWRDDPDKFYQEASSYLEKRTLRQQFEGIYLLYKHWVRARTFIFKLANVQTYEKLHLSYGGVEFSNSYFKEYAPKGSRKEYAQFFRGRRKIYVRVTVKKGDESTALLEAKREIRNALNFFNANLNSNAHIDSDDYVVSDSETSQRKTSFTKVIHPDTGQRTFDSESISKYLKTLKSGFAQRLISSDRVYFQAVSSPNSEDMLVNHWRYLESFFDNGDYNSDDVKEKVSTLLSLNSVIHFDFVSLKHASEIFYSSSIGFVPERFGVSRKELWELIHPGFIANTNFRRMNELINNPYINRRLSSLLATSKREKINIAHSFYKNILFEAYEQRNLIEHSGISDEKAVEKVLLTLPTMTKEFRRLMATEAKDSSANSLDDVIAILKSK